MTQPPPLGGRYALGRTLGRGGMADVRQASDLVLGREVAVKLLRDVGEVDRERFASEARLLAQLSHPSIVTLYDAGVDDAQPWLVLELIDGPSLSAVLRERTVGAVELAGIGSAVAAGLAHAHARGVVHRDLKPANVLLRSDGRVTLADFGIARLAGSAAGPTLTGHAVGTAAYLAPEQVRGEEVTTAADIYSLGLVLLEVLTGVRAFDGPPVEAALARVSRGPLIPASLPRGWHPLLTSMTAGDPAARPSADEVSARLAGLSTGTVAAEADDTVASAVVPLVGPAEGGATPLAHLMRGPVAAAAPAVSAADPSERRGSRAVLVAAAAALVVLLGAVGLSQLGTGDGEDSAVAAAVESPAASPSASPTPSPTRSPAARQTGAVAAVADTVPSTPSTPRSTPTRRPSSAPAPAPAKPGKKAGARKPGKTKPAKAGKGAKSKASKPTKAAKPGKATKGPGKGKRPRPTISG